MKKLKLNINKFTISKLTNLSTIHGGNDESINHQACISTTDTIVDRPKCKNNSNDYVIDIFDNAY